MRRTGYRIAAICFVLLGLTGCGLSGENTGTLRLPENTVYLCARDGDYNSGVVVYASGGDEILDLEDACVEYVISPQGDLVEPMVGQIGEDSLLFLNMGSAYNGGLWDIATRSWIVEPSGNSFAFTVRDGKLQSFEIGGQEYDGQLRSVESGTQETFRIGELVLTNGTGADGEVCIYDSQGQVYLDGDRLSQKNRSLGIAIPQAGMEIVDTVGDRFLILRGVYELPESDGGDYYIEYLCDAEGNILYSDWNRRYIGYARNQYGQTDEAYLEFRDLYGGNPSQFLDLTTGREIVVTEEYDSIQYGGNGLFLFGKGREYCIYDARNDVYGDTFTVTAPLTDQYVFGLDSYAVHSALGREYNRIVIDGQEMELSEEAGIVSVKGGAYTVVLEGNAAGTSFERSYILDDTGSLVMEESGDVICADHSYYLEERNGRFDIREYPEDIGAKINSTEKADGETAEPESSYWREPETWREVIVGAEESQPESTETETAEETETAAGQIVVVGEEG